jgi:flagellar FliL protein
MKNILLIVLAAVVLIGITGAATYFFVVDKSPEKSVEEGADSNEEAEVDKSAPEIYHTLHPNFVVNFQSPKRERYLQVSVEIMTRSEEVVDAVKKHMPVIRNSLVMLFGSQDAQELRSREGKETLRQDVLGEIQKVLEERIGESGVEEAYFTSFVMQ